MGANYWKELAGRGRKGLTEEYRAALICPNDDAPLDYLETSQSFKCPACARAFEDRDGVLSVMPTGDNYRLRESEIAALEAEAATIAADGRTAEDRYPALVPLVEKLAGKLEGRRVLDLCCGNGWAAAWFADRGARVAAVDAVAGVGGLASARGRGDRVDCFQGDVCRLPFAPETFDIVFMADAMNRIARPERLARELGRILRRGGIVINLGEPLGRGSIALGGSDPRHHGRSLGMDDYRGIYREGGLDCRAVFVDGSGLAPARGMFQKMAARRREANPDGERLLVARHQAPLALPRLAMPWGRKEKADA